MGNYTRGSYHGSHPRWRNSFNQVGHFIGIEFEVDSPNYARVLELLPDFRRNRPLTECDGSLGNGGVEIIFPPISLSQIKRADCVFHRAVAAIKDVVQHNTRTGMHMNVNTRGWSDKETAVFCAVVHHLTDEQLRNLGGRSPTEYCLPARRRGLDFYKRGRYNHYVADNKDHRIELRFPMSTCNKENLDGLVDFIERLTTFAGTKTELAVTKVDNNINSYGVDYTEFMATFFEFLSKTKKGRKVLDILNTDKEEAEEPDYDADEDDDYYYDY